MNPLLTATQLVNWADERRSQDTLPLLIARLLLATVDPIEIDFASGDSVNRPGYDGILRVVDGAALVPSGQSVWELGTGQTPSTKANEDYKSRTESPEGVIPAETTFVFVTPRRWQSKSEWADEKRAEKRWLDVRAMDAVDLEQWLDRCHAVAAWGRRQIVGTPAGIRDLEEVWELWTTRTNPFLTPALFAAGRAPATERVRNWLSGPPSCLRIRGDSADEAVGFITSVIQLMETHLREQVLAKAVFVNDADVWRAVSGSRTPAVIVAATAGLGSEVHAVNRGHHVAVAYGNESGGVEVDVDLSPLRRNELEAALRGMGISDERSRELAAESRGRLTAIIDLLGGGTSVPHWATPEVGPQLIPFLLAGSWGQRDGDIEAMCRLARVSRDELEQRLARWCNETDPPVRLVGGMWEWISRQRAWPHLGRFVTATDLTAFRQTVIDVLGENDPRLGLEPERRWMASLHNCAPRYSEPLRRGLAEGLAMLSCRPSCVRAAASPEPVVESAVRELFGDSPNPARWYTLASVLPFLAEATPEVFLSLVERDVVNNDDVRSVLFQQEGHFGGSRHCHLLWALETLAWSAEHLSGVVIALGGLTTRDPGGRTANRPAASLQTILLAWKSFTNASVAQKLAAIDALHRRYPDVSFHLCRNLIPSRFQTATPTPRPRWQPWALDPREDPTFAERRDYVVGLFTRVLAGASLDQGCWATLLDPLPDVPREQFDQLFSALESLPLERFAEETDDRLRRAVRTLLHRKRTIAGIHPELNDGYISRLEAVYARLSPIDRMLRDAWLFDTHPDLLSIRGHDWKQEGELRHQERTAVIRGFIECEAVDDLVKLAETVEDPSALGTYVGSSEVVESTITRFLDGCLESEHESLMKFAQGIVWGGFRDGGWTWVDRQFSDVIVRGWSASRKARFAFALPFESPTWDWIESWGEEVNTLYWQTHAGWLVDAQRDAPRAIASLLLSSRPFTAFQLADRCRSVHGVPDAINPDTLLTVLKAITAVATGELDSAEPMPPGGIGYELSEMLTAIETAGACDEQELVRIEWIWFPMLDHTRRGPAALFRTLAADPAIFAHLIQLNYWPRQSADDQLPRVVPDERSKALAQHAHRVLDDWRGVPGKRGDGEFDGNAVRLWVESARAILAASGHGEIGDEKIGEVLARIRWQDEEQWPPPYIRELIEDCQSDAMEKGLFVGVIEGRGMTVRSPYDGGEQELALADRLARWASAATSTPRTAEVLRRLVKNYRHDARHEDERRDLNEFWR
jgi:hypothetical protein